MTKVPKKDDHKRKREQGKRLDAAIKKYLKETSKGR
jgi:hypothetical protein